MLSYGKKPARGEIAPCHSRKTDNIETFEASAFGVCTIQLSDILITKALWTIQTAAKRSEGSQMGKKEEQNERKTEKETAGRSENGRM